MPIMKYKPLAGGDTSNEEVSLKSLKRPDVSDEMKLLEEKIERDKQKRREEQAERERERRERERRYNCCGCGC